MFDSLRLIALSVMVILMYLRKLLGLLVNYTQKFLLDRVDFNNVLVWGLDCIDNDLGQYFTTELYL